MPIESETTIKRQRGSNSGMEEFKRSRAITASSAFVSAQPLWTTEVEELFKSDVRNEAILIACRTALVKSPEAFRAALLKYRASLDRDIVKMLETVGAYECKVKLIISSSLKNTSFRRRFAYFNCLNSELLEYIISHL